MATSCHESIVHGTITLDSWDSIIHGTAYVNNTFSSLRLRKVLIVFTVQIVAGVSILLFVIFGTGIEYSISSVILYISMSDSLKALPTERSEYPEVTVPVVQSILFSKVVSSS